MMGEAEKTKNLCRLPAPGPAGLSSLQEWQQIRGAMKTPTIQWIPLGPGHAVGIGIRQDEREKVSSWGETFFDVDGSERAKEVGGRRFSSGQRRRRGSMQTSAASERAAKTQVIRRNIEMLLSRAPGTTRPRCLCQAGRQLYVHMLDMLHAVRCIRDDECGSVLFRVSPSHCCRAPVEFSTLVCVGQQQP